MKRIAFLVIVLASLAGAAYWVRTHYNGNVGAAWAALQSSVSKLIGTGSDTASRQAGANPGGGGRERGGQGPAPRTAVVTALADKVDLPITRAGVGLVEPIATVTVRARIDGEIIEQRVRDGQVVKEGDLLFRLDDREIQAQIARDEAALARDQATLARTQADVKRVQELLTRDNTTQQRADQAIADQKVAAANVAADQAAIQADRVKLGYTGITAPISGRAGVVRVTRGNLVRATETGDGLLTITQLKPLQVSFALPERDLDLLRTALAQNQPAPVRVYPSGADQVLATGGLTFIDSSVDPTSGTITAKATFPNEDGRLWPGQYVRVEVDLGHRPDTTTVPLVAIQPGQDGSFAFVLKPDQSVERRRVEVADTRGNRAAIASGIKPGERVVVEGQLRLRDGSPVTEKAPAAPEADARPNRTAKAD